LARILIWVRPGASSDGVAWDPWRQRWVVSCRAAPVRGAANRAVLSLVEGWLGGTPVRVRWTRAGASRGKVMEVDGLDQAEVDRRLRARAGNDPRAEHVNSD
jgi:uncharacterized protein YggU (UPF0235/DUF167 family)